MTLETLCTTFTGSTEAQIRVLISELQLDKKIKALEHNLNSFTRVQADQEVTVVKQMPKVEAAKQPTIAIITSQYFEKMAVDAMMSNRQTFVRYATVGRWARRQELLFCLSNFVVTNVLLLLQVFF